jgi:hypothetical protein
VLRGRPGRQLIVALLGELEALAASTDELRVLVDEREMSFALLGVVDVKEIVEAWRRSEALRTRARFAIFAPTSIAYGLNRMAQAFAGADGEGRAQVFRDEAAARDWLLTAGPG